MNNDYNNNNQQQSQQPYNNYQQPPQQPYNNYQQPYNNYQQPYQNGFDPALDSKATQAMVFGIIGLFFAGIIFGILAIVNASACKKAGFTNGKVTAGFVLGIIDLALLVLYMLVIIPAFMAALSAI